jgi:hypothetical protein
MTLEDLFSILGRHPLIVAGYFVGLPLLALLLRLLHGKYGAERPPWKYLYTALVYLTCIPGIFVFFLLIYLLLIMRTNFLTLDLVSYVLPLASMTVTLLLIRRWIRFDDIPGFRRLSGLFLLTGLSFSVLFILDRLRILLLFHSSIFLFIILWIAIFAVLKFAYRLLSGKR